MTASATLSNVGLECLHCGNAMNGVRGEFCCEGCRVVYGLLHDEHLERYYDLRGDRGAPVADLHLERRDRKWLEAVDSKRAAASGTTAVDVDVQGIHCAACVWLLQSLFERRAGGLRITVNPSLGRAHLVVDRSFDLGAWVGSVERFGYLVGPPLKHAERRSSAIAVRMGICIAIAMNAMIFAIAGYAGLDDGPTAALFTHWSLGLSFLSLAVGGSLFFRSAWEGIRRGVATLDLPIALGIALAFAGSLLAYRRHRASGVFVDTLDIFIALMLVGRFLQERVLERNRLALLESDGVDGLLTRREERGIPRTIRCAEVVVGDHLRIAPGELIPVDAIVETAARFSLDWINGESRAQSFEIGDVVPAGAFLASDRAVVVVACTAFAESPLVDLLKTTTVRTNERPMSTPWWQRVTKLYVALVLAAALVGFVGWTLVTHDLAKSLEVATAVLVVTCPCAFGIATPLGYELVQAGLRRAGLYVRSATFLDRAESVRTVVFDKTGTLTLGATSLRAPSALSALSIEERAILGSIAAASHHPKSVAVATAIGDVVAANDVIETVGGGLSLRSNGHDYRLGAPAWVDASARTKADLAFGVDGRILVELPTRETLRPDARAEIAKLRNAGTNVFLLSGDAPARVQEAAIDVGISTSNAMGGVSASDKARWVDAHQHDDLLMIGDGLNDALVADVAFTSGTPAIDRPFLATRSDFYFVTPGLGCIRLALEASKALGRVRRRNLRLALGYNAIAVVLAYAGVMSPLVCAVFMPVTSLSVVLTTVASLDSRSALWRS